MTELHQQLQESIREMERIREGIEYAAQLAIRIEEEERALEELEKTLTKEQRDVHILERESVTSLIRKFIGDREEKLEKENEEYMNVSERHIELYKSIELARYELGILKSKEDLIDSLQLKIDILLREREKELISLDPVTAVVLKSLDEDRIKHNAYLKKIEKIKTTGHTALAMVTSIENHLIEARKQIISNKAGSALLVDEEIDNARRPLAKANQLLVRFKKELSGIFSEISLKANIRLEKFDSYTIPVFLSGSTFKEKINISRRCVSEIKEQVEFNLNLLDHEFNETVGKLEGIEEERKRIILSSISAPNPNP